MSKKVHPLGIRIGFIENWRSNWFDIKNYSRLLEEDALIRKFIEKRLSGALLEKIEIKRSQNYLSIILHSARPGFIIGKGGAGIETLRKELQKLLRKHRGSRSNVEPQFKLDIKEIRHPERSAKIIALNVKEQIERRMPYRRVLKKTLERVPIDEHVKGIKIKISGRLNGAEIARSEWLKKGKIPLQTLRANIDYASVAAFTTYGTIGIKVWLYKGEVFEQQYKTKPTSNQNLTKG